MTGLATLVGALINLELGGWLEEQEIELLAFLKDGSA